MTRQYRVGAVGFAHMHINHLLDRFAELPNVEWVACADTVPAVRSMTDRRTTRAHNLKRAQDVIGIPRVYADYREMLERETLDIVVFCPENDQHPEVAEALAARGVHMVTEKPMAADLPGALRMARAALTHDVKLLVNWPTTWRPAIRMVRKLIEEGAIGEVWEVKWRNGASRGPMTYGPVPLTGPEKASEWWHQSATGGGALLDYCCYGACLARWYVGVPAAAAMALKANFASKYGDADDNAVITVRFPKAMAILEGSWSTAAAGVPTGPIVYGTEGTIVVTSKQLEVYTASKNPGEPDRIVEPDPLPQGRETVAEEFIHHIETGEAMHPTLDIIQNLDVMAILDAGIRSAASGKLEFVNNAARCIGQ